METGDIKLALFEPIEDEEPVAYDACKDVVEAEQMLGRIMIANQNIDRIKTFVEYVNNRASLLIDKEEERIEKAQDALEPFVKARIDENLKLDKNAKKSLKFTLGTAGFRRGQDRLEIKDMEGAVQFAESHNLPVKVVKSVGKTDLKNHVKSTGQIDDSFELIEGEEHFYVKGEA